jgi:hypothetical protein
LQPDNEPFEILGEEKDKRNSPHRETQNTYKKTKELHRNYKAYIHFPHSFF